MRQNRGFGEDKLDSDFRRLTRSAVGPRDESPDELPMVRTIWRNSSTPDTALAAWMLVSLVGLALGLGLAKYSQAWAGDVFPHGAILGSLVVFTSIAISLTASVHFMLLSAGLAPSRKLSRFLAILSISMVFQLGWAALSIIAFAGWEFPPERPR